jgi:hypothetical protein
MTEAEWLACPEPESLLKHIRDGASDRRLRLFACACCYRVYAGQEEGDEWAAVGVAERYADGLASAEELAGAEGEMDCGDYRYGPADYAASPDVGAAVGAAAAAALLIKYNLTYPDAHRARLYEVELAAQAALLRDIFGNPFRPVHFSDSWRTDTAVSLARQMYESRDFSAMPILADALQDAGCESDNILSHCRDTSLTHVRGCWVVDLMLGKAPEFVAAE